MNGSKSSAAAHCWHELQEAKAAPIDKTSAFSPTDLICASMALASQHQMPGIRPNSNLRQHTTTHELLSVRPHSGPTRLKARS